ncbi:flagellar hook-basal body protein [Halobacillus salinarum]|uniref:flagellar hook-basal body protein n=1 Tax=Halobacillus salinarum TaxID=2932257 RepID=UPI0037BFDFAE
MNRSMIQASVTMGQLQNKLDLIGNNLANTNTTGYKSRQANFASLLVQQMDNLDDEKAETGRLTPDGIRVGTGAKLAHTNLDLSHGSLKQTGRELDVALMRDNDLFQLEVDGQTQYTRAGNFYLNPAENGQMELTNADGFRVLGADGEPIVFDGDMDGITIREDGAVLVTRGRQQTVEGRLGIVQAIRPRMLEADGANRFRLPEGTPAAGILEAVNQNDTQIKSRTLEDSNVDISQQMTDLLMAQRAYQFNARSISTSDQMMGLVNQLRT